MTDDEIAGVMRTIDANLNRAREGLRVTEDAFRFIREDEFIQNELKEIRHSLASYESKIDPSGTLLLENRASDEDIGAFVDSVSEMSRDGVGSIIRANLRRSQEAMRSLEEYGKLLNEDTAELAKKLRFRLYELEKKMIVRD